jgi:hypothetical protein
MSAQTDAHDPRAPVKAQGRRKTPTPPQRCWGGSDDAVFGIRSRAVTDENKMGTLNRRVKA